MKLESALVVNRTGHEVRVALLRDGEPISLAIERGEADSVVGNIYAARVLRVVPGMQSAFVDAGLERAAFLYGGDVVAPSSSSDQDEESSLHTTEGSVGPGSLTVAADRGIQGAVSAQDDEETVIDVRLELGESDPGSPEGDPRDPESTLLPGPVAVTRSARPMPPRIETLLQPGQEILVQASKDAIGTKGARLTTQIALPGRFLVYMPLSDHAGVSRRIVDEVERERLRALAEEIRQPGEGFIVRTVCEGVDSDVLRADAASLRQLWAEIVEKRSTVRPPALVHGESDLVLRTVRDSFAEDIGKLLLDDAGDHQRALGFVRRFLPELEDRVELYSEPVPLFEVTGVERRIGRALGSRVRLPSGGYLVIETTEALTAVDVNSGRYTGGKDLEDTILTVNLEAAVAVVEQLRLRDIGGIIVVDFIDMSIEANRNQVDEALAAAMEGDPARCSALPISDFGLVQMTRRRVRENLGRNLLADCEHCAGTGRLKSVETVGYEILREIGRNAGGGDGSVRELVIRCSGDVASWLLTAERATVDELSDRLGSPIRVVSESAFPRERFAVSFQVRGRERA